MSAFRSFISSKDDGSAVCGTLLEISAECLGHVRGLDSSGAAELYEQMFDDAMKIRAMRLYSHISQGSVCVHFKRVERKLPIMHVISRLS
jgi:hypothetical protein